jgi:hypothetical protein
VCAPALPRRRECGAIQGVRNVLIALFALGWAGAAGATTAGVFQFVVGDVRIVAAPGSERTARKGALLNVGEVIATADKSTAQIKMGDGAIVVVQPRSRLAVAVYQFSGVEDGTERVVFRLEQGGFRSVTGAIGNTRKNSYSIETPIAHMGVRGTDHESYYFPPGGSETPGAYNKVNTGLTFIRTSGGEVVIPPNQVGYVRSQQDVPGLLPSIPGFFNRAVAPRTSQLQSPPPGQTQPPVVQTVTTTDGVNLSNPAATPPGSLPGEGLVAGFSVPQGGTFFGRSAVNPTIAPNGAALVNAGGDTAFGVDWGTWQGNAPTVNGVRTIGSVHFAHSTRLTTEAQLGALGASGVSATYNHLGGPNPTNQNGTQGTINSWSVNVNFGTQAISNYAVSATVAGRTWNVNGSGTFGQFTGSQGINLQGNCAGCNGGPPAAATGSAHGAFVGSAAEKMISSFGLKSANETISGAGYLGR